MITSVTFRTWAPFALASVLSLVAYKALWMSSTYLQILTCLAIASVILGGYAVWRTRLRAWSVAAVLIGLIIGQWWLVESILTLSLWRWRGFAP
jgi:uncharacterized membrane protein YqgA involved in biofilm formation